MTLPLPMELGTKIDGHYIVGPLLSRGGFGAVYRGIDTSAGDRVCAIKETYDVTPAARRQGLMEASILLTVKSRHLPQVYDAFEENGRFYLVMQLIEGQTLLQLLKARGGPFTEAQALGWLLPIMQVLEELHRRTPAVIHRDIKPGNIILTPNSVAVLVDFGLTKLYDPLSDTQTMVRAFSEGFSPIEQYVGKTSPQSDIYSMAATMYMLLTAIQPPSAISRSVQDELVAPRVINPALSPKIERVLLKALAVNAGERYASMYEFSQALQEPDFTAFADPTISGNSVPVPAVGARHTEADKLQPPSHFAGTPKNIAARRPAGGAVPKGNGYGPSPVPANAVHGTPAYPGMGNVPPGYVLVPQGAVTQSLQPLPSPFRQGCLWGTLQGVLAALMLLLLKKDAYFDVAILEGFAFYVLAGFFTLHKGGRLYRGALAGFWAGITSSFVFWVALAIGLVVLLTQRIQADTRAAQRGGYTLQADKELSHAWQVVGPAFLSHPTTSSTGGNLTTFLASGLLLAVGFGLLGGVLGRSRYKARLHRKMMSFNK